MSLFCLSATPELVSAPRMGDQDQVASEAQAIASVNLDASQPVTNIQIRLADGGRLVQKFNHTHRSVLEPLSSTSPYSHHYKQHIKYSYLSFLLSTGCRTCVSLWWELDL